MGVDLTAGRWRTLSASVAGTAHTRVGEPCADASAVRVLKGADGGPLLVAVAADGAGASPRAKDGARLACEAILEQARRWRPARSRESARRKSPPVPRDLRAFEREDVARFVDGRARVARSRPPRLAGRADFFRVRSWSRSSTSTQGLLPDRRRSHRVPGGLTLRAGALAPERRVRQLHLLPHRPRRGDPRAGEAGAAASTSVALFTDGLQGAGAPFREPRGARAVLRADVRAPARRVKATRPRSPRGAARFWTRPAVNQRTDDDQTLLRDAAVLSHAQLLRPARERSGLGRCLGQGAAKAPSLGRQPAGTVAKIYARRPDEHASRKLRGDGAARYRGASARSPLAAGPAPRSAHRERRGLPDAAHRATRDSRLYGPADCKSRSRTPAGAS